MQTQKIYDFEIQFPDGDMFKPEVIAKIKSLPLDKQIILDYTNHNRFDLISYQQYGSSNLWWIIALYNDIVDIHTNTKFKIKIPKFENIIKAFAV